MLHIVANQSDNNHIMLKQSWYRLFDNKFQALKVKSEFGGIKGITHIKGDRLGWSYIRLATRVLIVAPVTFMIMQQMSHTICSPKFIAIFSHVEKIWRVKQITRMRNSIISLDKGSSSDRGYNCEAKLSHEHFWTIYDLWVHETFFRRVYSVNMDL